MAHKRSTRTSQRDLQTPTTPIASDPLLDGLSGPGAQADVIDPLVDDPLLGFEDGRSFGTPVGRISRFSADVVSYPVTYAKNVISKALFEGVPGVREVNRIKTYAEAALAFRDPARVAVCVRRQIRREVLFALSLRRHIGSGRGKRRRRNWASAIRC